MSHDDAMNDQIAALQDEIERTSALLAEITHGEITMTVPYWVVESGLNQPITFTFGIEAIDLQPKSPLTLQLASVFETWATRLRCASRHGR